MTSTSLVHKTDFVISLFEGSDIELSLVVAYDYHPGSPGSRDEPATGDTVEITHLVVTQRDSDEKLTISPWLCTMIEADKSLADSLLQNARDESSNEAALALEYRAEAAREDRADQARGYGRATGYESD